MDTGGLALPEDVYTHGHAEPVLRAHRWRTAENSAAYLLPHLRPEARILDVGCGPGTITCDLAGQVPHGHVTGVDRAESVVDDARAHAVSAGVANVSFEAGDVYALEHADGGFDVVHAHQLLQHLTDPVAALREMRRVCRPGGLVAARDADYAAFAWWPRIAGLDEWLGLYRTVARRNGGEPDAGRRMRAWSRAVGFGEVISSASVWCFATPEDRAWWGGLWAERVSASQLADQARSMGLATDSDLARMAEAWRTWAAAPDGWFGVLHGEILCRV
ncbi:MAG: methyltransferase domain-containing protein [Propionibacteriales bacterium]|nr:methyltransferase domain-containing protein [Propionibacteriales bacterium]